MERCTLEAQAPLGEMAAILMAEAGLTAPNTLVVEAVAAALRVMEIMLLPFKAALVAKEQIGKA